MSVFGDSAYDHTDGRQPVRPRSDPSASAQAEDQRLRDEHEALRSALALLVRLKDGPRDSTYEIAKPLAWQAARDVLEQVQ